MVQADVLDKKFTAILSKWFGDRLTLIDSEFHILNFSGSVWLSQINRLSYEFVNEIVMKFGQSSSSHD